MSANYDRMREIARQNKRAERRERAGEKVGQTLISKHYNKDCNFARYPVYVLESQAVRDLSPMARTLLDALAIAEYPCINGWLICSRSTIKRVLKSMSDDTAHRALKELLDARLVVITRAARGRSPPLCALTWLPLSRDLSAGAKGKLDWPDWNQWMALEPREQEIRKLHSPVGRRPRKGPKPVPPKRAKAPKPQTTESTAGTEATG